VHAAERVQEYETCHAVDVGNRALRVIVLFSGGGSVEDAIRAFYPHNDIEIVAIDNSSKSSATILTDIREFAQVGVFDWRPGYFDVLWASPPCTEYSRAKSVGVRDLEGADTLVAAALACLLWLRPRYWFIENPVGLLQTRPIMIPFQPYLHHVSYCRYNEPVRKDTCLWTNAPVKNLRICRRTSLCPTKAAYGRHLRTAQAGPTAQAPGSGAAKNVYHIPRPLLRDLLGPSVLAWTLVAELSELL
jgi:site-specific DNA-cytosine methylase